ncbi:peptide/nickel transport system permease protein [Dongia mobilis]|uniref:Peptide/nickel transport system permease protein n=1 Tax=Dongia mobilis TaxID=578943 RepID=A0A4R6WFX0_9PROT|nr:ABC transporter permease [Dongia mobilis]TDQ78976.1 peptide/nickel transport system permease protein [Dongia mobilis]
MLTFILRRLGVMLLTMLCLSLVVFAFVNLEPNLRKLAIFQTEMRASDQDLENWLQRNGYRDDFTIRFGRWIGVWPKEPVIDPSTGQPVPRFRYCDESTETSFSGVLQGDFGCSTAFRTPVADRLSEALAATGILMFWVMVVMVPVSLLIGVLAGMREGSRLDRTLSVASIVSTATPEYVSAVIFTAIFASWLGWLNGSAATALTKGISFNNFTLPVMTMAIYGIGYIARMTRASMAEVMTAQYIRTARLKGLSFGAIVVKHALRNALIAPFTVIMLQFPWLLTGVVVVESIFNYKGFGWLLVQAASNNDIDLVLACGLVSVAVVLLTQLISDVGYALLNPRIRVS